MVDSAFKNWQIQLSKIGCLLMNKIWSHDKCSMLEQTQGRSNLRPNHTSNWKFLMILVFLCKCWIGNNVQLFDSHLTWPWCWVLFNSNIVFILENASHFWLVWVGMWQTIKKEIHMYPGLATLRFVFCSCT